jgi:hypothetical protein
MRSWLVMLPESPVSRDEDEKMDRNIQTFWLKLR